MASASPAATALRARLRETIELLESIAADRSVLAGVPDDERKRLLQAVAAVYHPDRVERRRMANALAKQRKAARVKQDQGVLHETGIRALRRKRVFHTPNVFPPEGFEPKDVHVAPTEVAACDAQTSTELQHCYVCKHKYSVIHLFYDQLCPACAKLNFAKRTERADLRGRVAVLTGGRVKIGYQAGIKLLRSGAHLIVTTRFPRDSAKRYAAEPDFADWEHRLEIFALDLRHTPSVEAFCRELLDTRARLDFIVNNACQTVRRPRVEQLAAEGFDARGVAQIEGEDLESVLPVGEVGLGRVALRAIARKARGDDQVRARPQQLDPRLIPDLDAAARQQRHTAAKIGQLGPFREIELRARRAELIVKVMNDGVLLLTDIAMLQLG